MSLTLICTAMPQEAALICPRLAPASAVGGRPVWVGELGGKRLVLVLTGMGMVNAAQAVTAVLENFKGIKEVINFGCAGAYEKAGLGMGGVLVADGVVLADQGVLTQRKSYGLEKIGIPLGADPQGDPIFNRPPVDKELGDSLAAHTPGAGRGLFATVGQVSGDLETARAVSRRWGAALEDMESAAVAQVAAHYRLPFAAARGVSNQAGDRDLDVAAGARAAERVIAAWAGGA